MKHTRKISLMLALVMLVGICNISVSFAASYKTLAIGEVTEAEDGTVNKNHAEVIKSDDASDKKAVTLTTDNRPTPAADAEAVTFSVEISERAEYNLNLLINCSHGGNDSFFYSFTTGEPVYKEIFLNESYHGKFEWLNISLGFLDAGTYNFRVVGREPGFVLDAVSVTTNTISYDDVKAEYAEPLISGDVKYPKLIEDYNIGYVTPFEDGDRVAFIGDSITHGTYGAFYEKQIFSYYATRYPNAKFSYLNKGIDGDTLGHIFNRFEHDIFDPEQEKFNKVVILIGNNDMARTAYFEGMETKPDAAKSRLERFNSYNLNLEKLVALLKDKGMEQIILLSPSFFDEWLWYEEGTSGPGYTNKPTSVDFNNVLRRGAWIANSVAKAADSDECEVSFVDFNISQLKVARYHRFDKDGKENTAFTIASDRVHTSDAAHYISTYAILKAQGESGEVAAVEIDAPAATSSASNATIANLSASADKVEYTYKANALPMAADANYRTAETYFPITDELNREIIKVTGLADGVYDIKMDGSVVMSATSAQLSEGINIADKENNPGQQQALTVLGLAEARRVKDAAYRAFILNESRNVIQKYKFTSTDTAGLIAEAEGFIAANPDKASDITTLTAYIAEKKTEKDVVSTIYSFEEEAYKNNKPKEHEVVIEKSTSAPTEVINAEYFDYALPENTVITRRNPENEDVAIKLNGCYLFSDVAPTIIDGRTLIPMRAIFEALGAEVSWDEATATATAKGLTKNGEVEIKLSENQKTVYVNATATELDVPAMIINGRFVVPVRFVSETLGAKVGWTEALQLVTIEADIIDPNAVIIKNPISVASVQQSGDDGSGNSIENSIDQNLSTRWAPEGKDGAAWGIYDLGQVYTLDKVYLAYHNGNSRTYYFDIEVSEDGENYTSVIKGGKSSGETNDYEEYDLGAVKARYVKYLGGGNSANLWNSVTEIVFSEKK